MWKLGHKPRRWSLRGRYCHRNKSLQIGIANSNQIQIRRSPKQPTLPMPRAIPIATRFHYFLDPIGTTISKVQAYSSKRALVPTFYNQTTKRTFVQRIVVHASTTTTMQTPKHNLNQKTNLNHNPLERLCRACSNNNINKEEEQACAWRVLVLSETKPFFALHKEKQSHRSRNLATRVCLSQKQLCLFKSQKAILTLKTFLCATLTTTSQTTYAIRGK